MVAASRNAPASSPARPRSRRNLFNLLLAVGKLGAHDAPHELGHVGGVRDRVRRQQAPAQGVGAGAALLQLASQSPAQRLVQLFGQVRANAAQARGILVDDLEQRTDLVLGVVQAFPDDRLPGHGPGRPHVAALVDLHAPRLLGRHVGDLALDLPGARVARRVRHLGDAEVGEPAHTVGADQDVVG